MPPAQLGDFRPRLRFPSFNTATICSSLNRPCFMPAFPADTNPFVGYPQGERPTFGNMTRRDYRFL